MCETRIETVYLVDEGIYQRHGAGARMVPDLAGLRGKRAHVTERLERKRVEVHLE